MRTAATAFAALAMLVATAGCGKKSMFTSPDPGARATAASVPSAQAAPAALPAASTGGQGNGRAGAMPAYYDAHLFTINFTELSTAEATLIARNPNFNTIFTDDVDMVNGAPFVSVLDAIQTDGFNPLWLEVEVRFNAGHTPRQLFSDDEVAAAAASGEVTLHGTTEIYRCSVIGPKQ